MKKEDQKLFVVRKYIWAKSAQEALDKDKKTPAQDVWIDEDWKKMSGDKSANPVGFYCR